MSKIENEKSQTGAPQPRPPRHAVSDLIERGRQYAKTAIRAAYKTEEGLVVNLRARKLLRGRGEFIFVSAMPKSGSTFLSRTIAQITGFNYEPMISGFERNEQELYLPKLVDNYNRPTVTQQHTKATGPNLDLFNRFGIRPVILVRNIFDVVLSIRDYLLKEGVAHFPSLYATEHFTTLSRDEQYDFIITFAIPWYFNFYVSWFDATRDKRIEALWLTYENLIEDWVAGISAVLEFYDIEHSEADVRSSVEMMQRRPADTRMNKGVAGRGETGLSAAQKDRIITMKQYYPWVDFSRMAL
jgi:hypothetical protein